jgi:thiol-disulfide isomerase/thioredoxin
MSWLKNWKMLGIAAVVVVLLATLWYGRGNSRDGFQNPTENTFTMYYADWCGHCKNAKPAFQELIKKGPVDINGVKCQIRMVSPEKQPELAKGKPIRGFPTFLLETTDGQTAEYRGPREPEGYLEFINKSLGGKVGDVSGDTEAST